MGSEEALIPGLTLRLSDRQLKAVIPLYSCPIWLWRTAQLKTTLFPVGRVEIRKRPTNQGNHFSGYNWAKIYPSPEAPKELAITVGIDADDGFVVMRTSQH